MLSELRKNCMSSTVGRLPESRFFVCCVVVRFELRVWYLYHTYLRPSPDQLNSSVWKRKEELEEIYMKGILPRMKKKKKKKKKARQEKKEEKKKKREKHRKPE